MRTDVELEFADGSYLFRITPSGVDEIQRKCGCGIGEVYARIIAGRYFLPGESGTTGNPLEARYKLEDLREIIRQGLIGGGKALVDGKQIAVDAPLANQLVQNYFGGENRPALSEAWGVAAGVVLALMEGFEDFEHPVKKKRESSEQMSGEVGLTTPAASAFSRPSTSTQSKRRAKSRSRSTTRSSRGGTSTTKVKTT